MRRRELLWVLIVAGLLASGWYIFQKGRIGSEPDIAIDGMDELQERLAQRARRQLGYENDFQIAVTQIVFPTAR
jgi:hypothetical protein